LVAALEEKLPPSSMIFELPVAGFPESGPVREMQDYEHFRPYLHSHSLRFSYGNVKGRTRERWQTEAVRFGGPFLVKTLERYGFSAILINKKAYEAKGAALLAELASAGHSEILCESDDLVCLRIQPALSPILPPEFDRHWSELEGGAADYWRWSDGDASVILYNQGLQPREMRIAFSLSSLRSRTIQVSAAGQELFAGSFPEGLSSKPVRLVVNVPPGRCELLFHTNVPAAPPGNGDGRKLAFNISHFTIED
jgi:phosphoglycerol transferase